MLDRLLKEIPRLTDAVARAEFNGNGSHEVTETGAADTMREVAARPSAPPAVGAGQAKRTARRVLLRPKCAGGLNAWAEQFADGGRSSVRSHPVVRLHLVRSGSKRLSVETPFHPSERCDMESIRQAMSGNARSALSP